MKYFYFIIQLLVAFYLAKFASDYVLSGNYYYIAIVFAGSVYFLVSSWRHKFIVFSLMIFFPVLLPRYFPLPMKTLAELLAFPMCLVAFAETIKRGQSLFSRKASIYFVAISILALWTITHYILNPVLGARTFGVKLTAGGLKTYFIIFAGMATFLSSYLFFKNSKLNVERCLFFLLIISLVLGNLYIIDFFSRVPMLRNIGLGTQFIPGEYLQYQSIPLRIMHILGTCLLLTLFNNKIWGFYFIIAFINTIVFMMFGGGRSSPPMALLAIFAYVTLINRKYIVPVLSLILISAGIYVLYFSDITLSEYKVGRAFKIKGGLQEQDEARYYSFLYMYEVFKKSPIIGKGIGYEEITGQEEFFKEHPEALKNILYIKYQLLIGGHGTYLSILSIFGIGGFFWLAVLLFGSIYYSYRLIKTNNGSSNQDTMIALFVFLQMLTISVAFVVGGAGGYENLKFWFLAGTVAGLISKDRTGNDIELLNSPKTVSL